ncbi:MULTISPECIES: DUF1778 domain-containing protein [unclassified Bifidobacterium]|uniref:type II toxin -antitoxin system TacA 1-like antitoxin n=1 Tax=unclassified Bifidobacterium TaxID=2608897 RepID=UPI0023F672D0|nr:MULTISPECIES: DUF1778 domain-containing protein [unclassified Bifidobacterium]WEV66053.1 DUF1778 domain-containing protein [Bifidobacterium sp. ESL0764]WEV75155.1 DUF1778 domain-containing protein [Bifidobacterium sp. ESL0800]
MNDTQNADIQFNISVSKDQLALMKRAAALEERPVADWAADKLLEAADQSVEQEVTLQEVNEEFDKILATFEVPANV